MAILSKTAKKIALFLVKNGINYRKLKLKKWKKAF